MKKDKIYQVGDVMYDAILFYQQIAQSRSRICDSLALQPSEYVLATIHWAENTDDPARLLTIFEQLSLIAKDKVVVLPLHPRTRSYLRKNYNTDRFRVIDPVGYFDMILLQKNCRLIVTDSGGMQKEAFFNKKYCITVRDETEWVELVHNSVNFLVSPSGLAQRVLDLWDTPFRGNIADLYGNGNSAFTIFDILKSKY